MKEIEQEAYGEHGMATDEDPKQTAAIDLSKRLKDLRAGNDGSSQKGFLQLTAQSFTCCKFRTKHNLDKHGPFLRMTRDNLNRCAFMHG